MLLFRLIKIFYHIITFGLDELIFSHGKLKPIHSTLKCVLFWRNLSTPRGERLRFALERLGPIFVKFGQMLSTRRDLIPPDIADELAKLQDQVPPFAFEQVEKIIETSFDQPLKAVFNEFSASPVASASVAQVHFAKLYSGVEVAVKVLRPNIAKTIAKDLALMDTMAYLLSALSGEMKRLKPRELVAEFARHTESELDLTLEAANCSQLGRNFADKKVLLVPEVYWDWCRKEVMVMQRMHGVPISQRDKLIAHGIDIPQLAKDGIEVFFTQVFRDGFFHADMHPGNIQIAVDGPYKGHYIALDFGIMGTLSDTDKYYLARNFLAFFNRDYRDVAQAHIDSGWVPADTRRDELETAVRAICEPIFDKPIKEISFARTLLSLFQMARRFGVIIQPQLIMLQKTLLNIEGLGRELDPDLDLWKSASPFLKRWMSEQVGWRSVLKNLKHELPEIARTLPQLPRLVHAHYSQLAEKNGHSMMSQDDLLQLRKEHQSLRKWVCLIGISVAFILLLQLYIILTNTHI
jgi:ubiquinone biosynthesis protein